MWPAEIREPRKELAARLVIGVDGVVILYLAVNFVCVRVLGVYWSGGNKYAGFRCYAPGTWSIGELAPIAAGIAISTLGFLSQGMLTAPRVYFAMAQDGLFFGVVGKTEPAQDSECLLSRSRCKDYSQPLSHVSGQYDQILNYVVSADFIFLA